MRRYTKFKMPIPEALGNERVSDLSLPYWTHSKDTERILFVFDQVDRFDYRDRKLLSPSGIIGPFLDTVDREAKKRCKKSWQDFNVCTINLNYLSPKNREEDSEEDEEERRSQFDDLNRKRVLSVVKKFKPHRIVALGYKSFVLFSNFFKEPYYRNAKYSNLLGVPVPLQIGEHSATLFSLLNPSHVCRFHDDRSAYLIGYFIHGWVNMLHGALYYDSQLRESDIKIQVVDTIKKFDKLVDHLKTVKIVAIDTETENLNKIDNRIVIIQFSTSKHNAFVLPLYHFETPFTKQEIEHIVTRLREFFTENQNEFHLYANANFDIPLIRQAFNFPFYKTPIWDVQAGEFALDENMMQLGSVTDEDYYGLGNLSVQYGFHGYISGKFGKEDRAGISKSSLQTQGLIEYCGYDTAVLFGIYEQQIRRARDAKHDKYENVVKYLIGDTIHTFSTMNINGVLVDKNYLWSLSGANSPIIGEVQKMEAEILSSPEVLEAQRRIRIQNKIPTKGLFGNINSKTSIFSLRKKDHLKTLFFDVLQLQPINRGKEGPALDRTFQEEYQDIPLVSAYTNLVKAKKIRDAFVKSLIKIVSKDADARKDSRIRPSFNYLRVVTGRTSANNPNLQQVPSRGKLSKYIKRIFVARPGSVFVKVDYSAHEVRGWSIISGDKVLASAFQKGIDLFHQYLKEPTPENLKKFEEEGDIHIINSAYFFGLKVSEVTKEIRQSVKGVTFGLIYGRSANSLAIQLNKTLEEVESIIDKFFNRFKVAATWLNEVERFARKHYYVEAPTGLRRHLWPYLLPKTEDTERQWNALAAACDRRARNSPIQGMGSGIGYSAARLVETMMYEKFSDQLGERLPVRNQNMVHDSMEHEVDIEYLGHGLEIIRYGLTKGVEEKCQKLFGMKFPVDLSIDMEIGPTLDETQKWDGSIQELYRILKETFTYQKEQLKYDLEVEECLRKVFTGYLPKILRYQAKNGYFDQAEKYGLL